MATETSRYHVLRYDGSHYNYECPTGLMASGSWDRRPKACDGIGCRRELIEQSTLDAAIEAARASDAEQLSELRKACKAALPYVREVLAYTRSKPRTRCAIRTIEQLQKAIGGTDEKAVNHRNVSMERESGVQRMDTNRESDTDNCHSTSNDAGGPEESGDIS